MDNFALIVAAILFLISTTASAGAAGASPTITWVDGPAPGLYQKTATLTQIYTDFPQYGGHYVQTFDTSPVVSSSANKLKYISPASTATSAKIASLVSIPITAGQKIGATLTGVISKSNLAAGAMALVRLNPYVSTAITLGWLANAGINYVSSSNSFTQNSNATTSTCPRTYVGDTFWKSSSSLWFYVSQATYTYPVYNYHCPTGPAGSTLTGVCNSPDSNLVVTCQYSGVTSSPVTPDTDQQAQNRLANSPLTSSGDSAPTFDGAINEQTSNGIMPNLDGNPPTLSGPTTPIQGNSSTTSNPDGSTTSTNSTITPSYSQDHMNLAETTTTTNTSPTGTVTTTTTTGNGSDVTSPSTSSQSQTDCDKYPNNIGCSQYGTVPTPDTIPTTDVPITLSPSSWGSGSCPAPISLSLSTFGAGTKTFSLQPVCDFMTGVYPVVIAIAWLLAGYIVVGAVRD